MTRHPAQAALASCILAVFVFSRVSVHLRMCMLDGDGGGLGARGSIKRRCFQSDRGSSVFTPKGFQETDIPPKRVPPRRPRGSRVRSEPPVARSHGRLLFIYGGGEDFRAPQD